MFVTRKIRVLHFAGVINQNDFVDSIVRSLNPSLFEVFVCTFNSNVNIAKPEYHTLGIPHFVLNVFSRRDYLSAVRALIGIVKKYKIDILHSHLFDEAFIASTVALFLPNLKFVLGRHYSDEIYITAKGLQQKKSLFVEAIANTRANAIVVPSTFIEELLFKQGVSKKKIFRLPYGFFFQEKKYQQPLPEDVSSVQQEFNIEASSFVITNIGRHYFLKGQDDLLRAFSLHTKEFAKSKLLMVGDGPMHTELKMLAKTLKIEKNVIFTGWRKDARSIISASSVVVQPTLTEAFPQIMVETMALGKPLVITNVSGPCDQIIHGVNGYLVPKRDTQAIADTLKHIRNNEKAAMEVGLKGKEHVKNNLDIMTVIKGYEDLYIKLIT